jgi:hypothetical protein
LLTLGGYLIAHKFTRIWFVELTIEPPIVVELFGPNIEKPSIDWDEYVSGFAPDYPKNTTWFGPPVVREAEDGRKFAQVNLNDIRAKPIGVQPLDTRYKIDYAYLDDPLHNSNLKNLTWRFFDEKPVW